MQSLRALGRPEQQMTTTQNDLTTGLTLSTTDALGRQTSFTYDSCGNMTGVTRLAGTPSAITTTMAYQTPASGATCVSVFNQVTSVTDPLNHTTTFAFDSSQKNVTSITDALQHTVTIARNTNGDGQPASITDPLSDATTFGYDLSSHDLTKITVDPTGLNIATQRTLDLAGRLVRLQAPLGQITQYQYDALNELVKIVDPLNGQTNFTYDGNGNLLTVLDANHTNTTTYAATYTPNSMDRLGSRKDALLNSETYQYDLNGNPSFSLIARTR
jgi:YD repeat-containing protein